jgi:hypothetical protein
MGHGHKATASPAPDVGLTPLASTKTYQHLIVHFDMARTLCNGDNMVDGFTLGNVVLTQYLVTSALEEQQVQLQID